MKGKGQLLALVREAHQDVDRGPRLLSVNGWLFMMGVGRPDPHWVHDADEQFNQAGDSVFNIWFADQRPNLRFFGAGLIPIGRAHTKADWAYLREVVAFLRLPEGSLLTPFETTDPHRIHGWLWTEEP